MKRVLSLFLMYASVQAAGQGSGTTSLVSHRLKSYSRKQTTAFALFGNAAGLADLTSWNASLATERRFLLKELSHYFLALAGPLDKGYLGLAGSYGGIPEFHTSSIHAGYALPLGEGLNAAVQFQYYNEHISGSENQSAFTGGAGLLFHLTENVSAGFSIRNVNVRHNRKVPANLLPFTYEAGLGVAPSDQVYLSALLEKVAGSPVSVLSGIDYRFLSELGIVIGVATATSSYYFGVNYQLQEFTIQLIASVHPQLGITPGFTILYNRKKSNG